MMLIVLVASIKINIYFTTLCFPCVHQTVWSYMYYDTNHIIADSLVLGARRLAFLHQFHVNIFLCSNCKIFRVKNILFWQMLRLHGSDFSDSIHVYYRCTCHAYCRQHDSIYCESNMKSWAPRKGSDRNWEGLSSWTWNSCTATS